MWIITVEDEANFNDVLWRAGTTISREWAEAVGAEQRESYRAARIAGGETDLMYVEAIVCHVREINRV